jgi:hypothetical protein
LHFEYRAKFIKYKSRPLTVQIRKYQIIIYDVRSRVG